MPSRRRAYEVPTFDEVMQFANLWTSHVSLENNEAEAYYDLVQSLPDHSTILEIGCQYGRTSAIAAKLNRGFDFHFVDAWTGPEGQNIRECWEFMMAQTGVSYKMYPVLSNNPLLPKLNADLVLFDADHTEPWVSHDCDRFLPMVKLHGYACFHDYGRDDINAVQRVVDSHPLIQEFERVRLEGTLLILRRWA